LAYWHPTDQTRPFTPFVVDLDIWYSTSLRLPDPVLVDPLTQQVYDVACERVNGAVRSLRSVPFTDYPLLICDRSIVSVSKPGE
jgi:hypothetical protein